MAKIPYLIRRKNVFYFRLAIPAKLRETIKVREIVHSLKTQDSNEATLKALKFAAHLKAILHDLKTGKRQTVCKTELFSINNHCTGAESISPRPASATSNTPQEPKLKRPALSVVVDDFLKRYDPSAKAMLGKLNATLPMFVELLGNKPVDEILQADINRFFDDAQRLPVRRDSKEFSGLPTQKIIEANSGPTIPEKTFKSTYRACLSALLPSIFCFGQSRSHAIPIKCFNDRNHESGKNQR